MESIQFQLPHLAQQEQAFGQNLESLIVLLMDSMKLLKLRSSC